MADKDERDPRIVKREEELLLNVAKRQENYKILVSYFSERDRFYMGAYHALNEVNPALAQLVADVYFASDFEDAERKKEEMAQRQDLMAQRQDFEGIAMLRCQIETRKIRLEKKIAEILRDASKRITELPITQDFKDSL